MFGKTHDSSNKIHGSSRRLEISNTPSPLLLNNQLPTRLSRFTFIGNIKKPPLTKLNEFSEMGLFKG